MGIGEFIYLLIWTLCATVNLYKRTVFGPYFAVFAVCNLLASGLSVFGINVANTLYLIQYFIAFLLLARLFKTKLTWLPYALGAIFLLHIYNFYFYKFFELESYFFIAFELPLLWLLRKEFRKEKQMLVVLTAHILYYYAGVADNIITIANMYELRETLVYMYVLYPLFFSYAAFRAIHYEIAPQKNVSS